MSKTRGRVTDVFTKPWNGRRGPITLHSFKIEGDDKYYRSGEQQVAALNDVIEFDYDANGNVKNVVKVADATTAPPAQAAVNRQGAARNMTKDQYWEEKEQYQRDVVEPRITWASAQSDAVVLVTSALQHDLLAFGSANKSAKLGLLLSYVDTVTERFAAQRYNAAALLKEAVESDKAAAAVEAEAGSELG